MTGYRITFTTREDADPEREQAALANVYAFLVRHKQQGIAAAGDPETINGTRSREVSADATSIPEKPLLHKRNLRLQGRGGAAPIR